MMILWIFLTARLGMAICRWTARWKADTCLHWWYPALTLILPASGSRYQKHCGNDGSVTSVLSGALITKGQGLMPDVLPEWKWHIMNWLSGEFVWNRMPNFGDIAEIELVFRSQAHYLRRYAGGDCFLLSHPDWGVHRIWFRIKAR